MEYELEVVGKTKIDRKKAGKERKLTDKYELASADETIKIVVSTGLQNIMDEGDVVILTDKLKQSKLESEKKGGKR